MNLRLTRREAMAGLGLAVAAPALAQREMDLEVPFVPTPHALVERMLDLAAVEAADYLIDLGCGDGRIPVAAGRRGARALGVDLDPTRIQEAAAAARVAGLAGRVRFRRQDLFATPIYEASVVALYLLPRINLRLRPRLMTELAPGARIVSHAFHLGDWGPDAAEEHDGRRIFLWHVPAVAGGSWDVVMGDTAISRSLELEQSYQQLEGHFRTGSTSVPVRGRLHGTSLTLGGAGTELRLAGRVEGDRISGEGWTAVRV